MVNATGRPSPKNQDISKNDKKMPNSYLFLAYNSAVFAQFAPEQLAWIELSMKNEEKLVIFSGKMMIFDDFLTVSRPEVGDL